MSETKSGTPIEESTRRIKQVVEWFPGATIPCGRQTGKTTAILEMIHERHHGRAVYVTFMPELAQMAKEMYRDKYPDDTQPKFTTDREALLGQGWPIYVDEVGLLHRKMCEALDDLDYLVQCRIGTKE